MARSYIGRLLLGPVVAFSMLLLLSPDAYGQSMTAVRKKCTISGSIGVAGVTMQGLPSMPQTDENGVYTDQVEWGWSGTVTPVKLGYTFEPKQRIYDGVKENKPKDDFVATLLTYEISGTVGKPGVTMRGFPGAEPVVSDASGRYRAIVEYGWSGTVIPEKPGYRFEPSSLNYSQVLQDKKSDNYQAFDLKFVISGSVGADGVVLQGLPGNPKSAGGLYRAEVPFGWKGKVTPTKEGHTFAPEFRDYPLVGQDIANENYTASVLSFRIPITTGIDSVVLKGLPGDPITDATGSYVAVVEYGFSAKVTPEKPGYTFDPPVKSFARVTADQDNVVFNASTIQLTISGNVGTGGVVMRGLPGNPTSDNAGFYSAKVDYEWSGTVTPEKDGYRFDPIDKIYSAVTQDQLNQTYKGSRITCQISGNVGLPGVVLKGLPGRVISKEDGSYSVEADYRWTATVTPEKAGYVFEPASREYREVTTPFPSDDYIARIIQHTIAGRIVTTTGSGLEGVQIIATNDTDTATTDANGEFQIQVDHGWNGQLTPKMEGYTINPLSRTFEPVLQDTATATFAASVRMMSISDSIVFGDEAIQGVTITAQPGGYRAITDARGKYTIQVPYGWTGDLFPTKEGFEFNPPSVAYASVTEDIDKTAPLGSTSLQSETPQTEPVPPIQDTTPVTPPIQDSTRITPPIDRSTTVQPPIQDVKPPVQRSGTGLTARDVVQRQLDQVQQELDALLAPGAQLGPQTQEQMKVLLQRYNQLQQLLTMADGTTAVTETPFNQAGTLPSGPVVPEPVTPKLLSTLMELSKVTNTKIAVDATVKDEPISTGIGSVEGLPVPLALQRILEGTTTEYKFDVLPDNTYLVYHPITNTFPGSDLRQALQDVGNEARVSILPDPNVAGETYASFTEVPLETALRMMLAGTQYVFKREPTHYLVADRSINSPGFPDVSETRHLRLSHNTPQRVRDLLPLQFQNYVQVEASSATDPNDRGHFLAVTAPTTMADRIMELVKNFDVPRRQVLLDARVVTMERGNMLNLGVAWDFPTLQYGYFSSDGDALSALGIGYSADQTFTSALMAKLNLLQSNNQADIVANPQLTALDGSQAQLRSIQEEWFMMSDRATSADPFGGFYSRAELQKIESGTVLTITPHVGDTNEITIEMAVEVSDSIPRGAGSDLPVVTRRQTKNKVTIQNGGTVAVAGLTENRNRLVDREVPGLGKLPIIGGLFRNKDSNKASREIAVFVTATLLPARGAAMVDNQSRVPEGLGIRTQSPAAPRMTKDDLAAALERTR